MKSRALVRFQHGVECRERVVLTLLVGLTSLSSTITGLASGW